MSVEFRAFAVLIPAGTPLATPAVTALPLSARIVERVRFRIPPGPHGSVGFALGSAGVRTIPWGANQWIVGDNEIIDWPMEDQIETGAWQFSGYNTGRWDHTIQIQFSLRPVSGRAGRELVGPLVIEPA